MQIACPSCKRQLRIADTAAGKKIKCPACGASFTALDQVEELVEPGPPPAKPKPKVDVVDVVAETPPPPRRARDDDEDRPRRSRDRDEDDEDDRPRRARDRDYDDEYDDDRGRRRRGDDDYDRPRRSRRRGSSAGSITGVGVISIILGSLTLLFGICLMIGALIGGAAAGGRQFGGNVLPQALAGILIVVSILVLLVGVLYLVGGIGVLQRRNWGRIVTLVSAGFSGIFGILMILSFIGNLISPMPMEAKVGPVLVAVLIALVCFAHCIMSFMVLLNSDNAREFN